MLNRIKLENILFLDIETVPQEVSFDVLDKDLQQLYADKTRYQRQDEHTPDAFYDRAGIWAEFGKIVVISVGYFKVENNKKQFRTTSFSGDEHHLLTEFKTLLEGHFNKSQHLLCAHNGNVFIIIF